MKAILVIFGLILMSILTYFLILPIILMFLVPLLLSILGLFLIAITFYGLYKLSIFVRTYRIKLHHEIQKFKQIKFIKYVSRKFLHRK